VFDTGIWDRVVPGTKPILKGAMVALLVESWRVWRKMEVGRVTRNVRNIGSSIGVGRGLCFDRESYDRFF
jgi:hypothetical protein